jgi:hypothetical protein
VSLEQREIVARDRITGRYAWSGLFDSFSVFELNALVTEVIEVCRKAEKGVMVAVLNFLEIRLFRKRDEVLKLARIAADAWVKQ